MPIDSRQGRRCLAVWICLLGVRSAFAQQAPLLDIQVSGAQRFAPAAVISASGLRIGQAAAAADFDAAVARLADTGLFTSVSYRYDPKTADGKSGYALTLQIQEAPVSRPVRLDFPGVDEQQLWQEVKREDGLVDSQMPVNPQSEAYYKRVIAAVLQRLNHGQEIVTKNEGDLRTQNGTIVFQGAHLPAIGGIAFEGNRLIDDEDLQAAMRKVALFGEGYSERYVRLLLDQNIKPIYEEHGRLTVAFPRVGMADGASGVLVSVTIEEGPEWNLGRVDLGGDGVPSEEMLKAAKFPEGRVANWKQIQASIGDAELVLKRNGYLSPTAQVARAYHNETHVVDLAIEVSKGRQSLFGTLALQGLSPADEQRARKMWELAAGAPVNPFYIDDYLRSMAAALKVKSISRQLRPRANSDVLDLTVMIR